MAARRVRSRGTSVIGRSHKCREAAYVGITLRVGVYLFVLTMNGRRGTNSSTVNPEFQGRPLTLELRWVGKGWNLGSAPFLRLRVAGRFIPLRHCCLVRSTFRAVKYAWNKDTTPIKRRCDAAEEIRPANMGLQRFGRQVASRFWNRNTTDGPTGFRSWNRQLYVFTFADFSKAMNKSRIPWRFCPSEFPVNLSSERWR